MYLKDSMSTFSHEEKHALDNPLRDIILGGQDGLVNALGIILGIAAVSSSVHILIATVLAATAAESISMGAVAYTSALAEKDHYYAERKKELDEIENKPKVEKEEIRDIYKQKGFSGKVLDEIVMTITQNKDMWLDTTQLTTRNGKKVTLSMIYCMLRNPFYYGEFEYPLNSGTWYKGAHQPLITKEVFEKVQQQLKVPRKSKWGAKGFAFKELMKCGNCGASIVGEDKYRKLRNGGVNYHIYYHCSKYVNFDCREPYVSEEELCKQLIRLIDELDENQITISEKLQGSLLAYQKVISGILRQEDIEIQEKTQGLKGYAKYALKEGTTKEKAELVKGLKIQLVLKDGHVQKIQ